MSESANVVAAWRGRAALLGREGWACVACGRISLARRRACVACGSTAGAERAPLPRRGAVAALSPAGAAVEHLDQVTGRKAAVLVELDGGARVACLLAHADSVSLMAELRGQPVRLAVRRVPLAVGAREPISYGMKAALDLETRSRLKEQAAQRAAGEGKKE
ncbi:MAG TPA: hypothetical protein VKZ63_04670 [Kofleriaceae bacterium]|nr:hypothetical protein [Kofleriaceae bacterium]